MIDFVSGFLVSKTPSSAVVDVGGVGFSLTISATTCGSIGQKGEQLTLFTRLIHREDAMELYGFANEFERSMFDRLTTAHGVGPKLASKILSGMPAQDLALAIRSRNINALTKIPGLGKKRAEKLCLELEDALSDLPIESAAPGMAESVDAIEALVALGFQRKDAMDAVRAAIAKLGNVPAPELVRSAMFDLKK
jgi:Holliday junction DNA helicase RuvA